MEFRDEFFAYLVLSMRDPFIDDLNFLSTSIRAMEFIINRNRLYANSNFEGVEEKYITHKISSINPQTRIVRKTLSNKIFPSQYN